VCGRSGDALLTLIDPFNPRVILMDKDPVADRQRIAPVRQE
jgi:hypothetical protein